MRIMHMAAMGLMLVIGSEVRAQTADAKKEEVDELELKLEVLATKAPLQIGRNTRIYFTFKNLTSKNIKLHIDPKRLRLEFLTLQVTDPDGESVEAQIAPYSPGTQPVHVAMLGKPDEFTAIAPSATWRNSAVIPGVWAVGKKEKRSYNFDKPGTYKIKAVYSSKGEQKSWKGTLTSNEVELEVVKAKK